MIGYILRNCLCCVYFRAFVFVNCIASLLCLSYSLISFCFTGPSTTKAVDDHEEAYRKLEWKYREEKETYDLYQILMARDKELYRLRLDIYEMTRALLENFGEERLIPPKPKYIPPPEVNIKPPAPLPKYVPPPPPPVNNPVAGPSEEDTPFRNRRSNEIFRSIMDSKSVEGIDELQDENNALLLSGSWEDIPPTEFSGDFDDDYGESGDGGS